MKKSLDVEYEQHQVPKKSIASKEVSHVQREASTTTGYELDYMQKSSLHLKRTGKL